MTSLEREVSALKAWVGAHEEDIVSIPDLIKLEFHLGSSQLARVARDVAQLRGDVAELKERQAGLVAQLEALPRIVAELVVEMIAERDEHR